LCIIIKFASNFKGESALLTEYRDREKAFQITEELLKTDFEGASVRFITLELKLLQPERER